MCGIASKQMGHAFAHMKVLWASHDTYHQHTPPIFHIRSTYIAWAHTDNERRPRIWSPYNMKPAYIYIYYLQIYICIHIPCMCIHNIYININNILAAIRAFEYRLYRCFYSLQCPHGIYYIETTVKIIRLQKPLLHTLNNIHMHAYVMHTPPSQPHTQPQHTKPISNGDSIF